MGGNGIERNYIMLKKTDLVERLSQKGYTKKDGGIIIDDVFKVIMEALVQGEAVRIYGFGTFEVKEYAARESIDLQTRERVELPAYKIPKFTAGKLLKRAVKEGLLRE